MLKPLALSAAALALLAACEPVPSATTPLPVSAPAINSSHPVALVGTSWHFATIGGTKVEDPLVTRITFGDGAVSGTFGCNEWTAPYQIEGGLLRIGMPGGTQYDCPGKTDFQEREGVRRIQMPMQVVQQGGRTVVLSGREGQNFVLELRQ
ncbi:META domain-containing protein [Paracoccus sp. S-4012]|uniref:META domain-containing protein n=1 Tax=Paracoccus sp. S-4012 TaxID=2665648 RepID=UPI0012B01DA0|nr:META domain-containing protein [Paracoccus sp. S-4012]MRX50227.1 META domain-containing protein [Paracoccus sp. S-4012]